MGLAPAIHIPIVAVAAQAVATRKALVPPCATSLHGALRGQDLAAARATGLQNVAAGAGLHAGAEAVHLGSLTLLGLKGTDRHVGTLLTNYYVTFAHGRTMPE